MAKLRLPKSWLSFRDMVIMYLFRLIGAPIKIDHQVLQETDPSLVFKDAVCLRFFNRGQLPVIIDDFQIILPGGYYTEGDVQGPGIDHKYHIRFLPSLPKADDFPDADEPFLFAGPRLDIRIFTRANS